MARRNAKDGGAIDPALSQKKRARRRLIGAAAVALAAAIVLPLVLDSEPRQQYPDVEVDIPSREIALREPVAPPAPASPADAGDRVAAGAGMDGGSASAPDLGTQPPPAESPAASESSPTPAPAPAPAASKPTAQQSPAKSRAAPDSPSTTGAKPAAGVAASTSAREPAAAIKPSRPPATPPAVAPASAPEPSPAPQQQASVAGRSNETQASRFVLQIGAYANAGSARSMSERARKVGVRSYTETVQTRDGARTRVRVGPFTDRESAERARGKRALVGIDSSVLALSQ